MYLTIFIILILFFFLCLIGIGITLVIMNNRNLNKISDKSDKTKNVTLYESQNLTTSETYGPKVLLEYDNNKRYSIINLYGNFLDNPSKTPPDISLAFSDTGRNWTVSGETEIASIQTTQNNRYDYMLQVSNIQFKYITVYVKGEVENFSCYIKLSI